MIDYRLPNPVQCTGGMVSTAALQFMGDLNWNSTWLKDTYHFYIVTSEVLIGGAPGAETPTNR